MKKSISEIRRLFGGKLIGTKKLQQSVCSVVSHLDEKMLTAVTKTCWFVGSMEDAWGFTLTGNDLKDQHLIFLGDELFMQTPDQISYTIAHEIGHVLLRHRNSILVRQDKKEISRQESEADTFAVALLHQ